MDSKTILQINFTAQVKVNKISVYGEKINTKMGNRFKVVNGKN